MCGGGGKGAAASQPPLEPVKSADTAIKEASTVAGRDQQLRRGLASAFSRSTMGGGASVGSSPTAGSAKKLGA